MAEIVNEFMTIDWDDEDDGEVIDEVNPDDVVSTTKAEFDIQTAILDVPDYGLAIDCKHNFVTPEHDSDDDDGHCGRCQDCGQEVWNYGGSWSICPF